MVVERICSPAAGRISWYTVEFQVERANEFSVVDENEGRGSLN